MAKKKPISRAEWNNIMVKAQQPPVLSFNSVRMIRAAEIASAYFPETAIELERILARELEIVDEVLCQLDIDILNADPNYWLDVQRVIWNKAREIAAKDTIAQSRTRLGKT